MGEEHFSTGSEKGLIEILEEMGFDMEGLGPNANLVDVFKKMNVSKIVVCDNVETFDTKHMEQMQKEGRIICEIPLDKDIDGPCPESEST
ncbi:MAG: hypothetical protein HUJ69_02810 [Lachnospiraceae bacterium]|nr:hypothetical protein [Lachnospiraceae bacterium]